MRYLLFLFSPILVAPAFSSPHQHEGSVTVGEQSYNYVAECDFLPIADETGKKIATVFYASYTKKGTDRRRPITFCFNGGPGSSTAWLHMGAFGPNRFLTEEACTSPPYIWIENQETLLPATDLVFIDSIGTGFSICQDQSNPYRYAETMADIESLKKAVSLYLQKEQRWNSPKYLIGESYGAIRVAGLAEALHEEGIYLEGAIFLSPALDYKVLGSSPYAFHGQIFSLPTYFLTGWHHQKAFQGQTLEEVVAFSKMFTTRKYVPFILSDACQDLEARQSMAKELASGTGIEENIWLENGLELDLFSFATSFFAEERELVGFYDTTSHSGYFPNLSSNNQDPSSTPTLGMFCAGIQSYFSEELGFSPPRPYKLLSYDLFHHWDFSSLEQRNYSFVHALEEAMGAHPTMRVFSASGYFDLVTPFAAAEYTFAKLDPRFYNNVTVQNYEGGHMMYLKERARKRLCQDLFSFYESAQ
ncbi:MAG: hypothetical protein AAGF04_05185 [Chlamydiota bacterium]